MTQPLHLYTIPPHRAFADALAQGLIRRFCGDPLRLARGVVLLPTNRAKRTITDAFVRASKGGLLLPRLVAIGDPELDEAAGPFLDPAEGDAPIPPAVDPLQRRMILARLIEQHDRASDGAEAVRLAGDLGRTLDQLLVDGIAPSALRNLTLPDHLTVHWQRALDLFEIILDKWPQELDRLGKIDLSDRRNRLLDRVSAEWTAQPPERFVCAAGIATAAPAIARLLRVVAGLPQGMVVLPGLDLEMDAPTWEMLGPFKPDPVTGRRRRSLETHPQFHLKLLLERMGVERTCFAMWKVATELDAPPARSKAIASAMMPAERTTLWSDLPAGERRLTGVRALEVATPAEEAQGIALALREALETPGRTAALVTPDRALAQRVAAHCARWNIAVDDTAGSPLSTLPPGTLLLALAEAAAQQFAPMALLSLLKHPLVRAGDGRLGWLEQVRWLDLALRGPRPAAGLSGVAAHLADPEGNGARTRGRAIEPWGQIAPLLAGIEAAFNSMVSPPATLLAALREGAEILCGDGLWAGVDGRAAAALFDDLEREAEHGPPLIAPASLPALLRNLMDEVAVRPVHGGHPRLSILGMIEAQLHSADLLILGGLNEGSWPGLPAPDPWLAPRIRSELGLPGLDRRIGLSAHDLAQALGARDVLLTRARRDASGPTIASRFWLRLEALSGGLEGAQTLEAWARAIDHPGEYTPVGRPAPCPPLAKRPRAIPVTDVDRLKADPYAFYAKRMLRLRALDPVDADPSAAWRGTVVHDVLEQWKKRDDCAPDALEPRVIAMLADAHPMMRALWQPRLIEAVRWIVKTMGDQPLRRIIDVEREGGIDVAGVRLTGKYDRIDAMGDGTIGIIDYKTGQPPTTKAVRAGYSLQLGLLGLIAERGGFDGITGTATCFEYWSLARRAGEFGYIATPVDPAEKWGRMKPEAFIPNALDNFADTAGRWLTGQEAFTAKLHPEYAPYSDYDQLMRRDEWYGREQR